MPETGPQSAAVSATTDKSSEPKMPVQTAPAPITSQKPESSSDHSSGGQSSSAPASSAPSKEKQARAVALQIANSIGEGTDLERVGQMAIVCQYCSRATYTTSGADYSTAYGVFIKGEYSCAGATRALGLVLECMGYQWEDVNPNQWTHQCCKLEMDDQIGFADGQTGLVGYGEHPVAK